MKIEEKGVDEKLEGILAELPFTLTEEQLGFVTGFINGTGNWTLLGDAGSGKSCVMYILKLYYEDIILFGASTGTASEELPHNIGSGTGHSLFNLARDQAIEGDWKKRPANILTKSDMIRIIVLDEGYCYNSQDLSIIMHQIKKINKKGKNRKARNVRLLLVGDPLQRLPIVSDKGFMKHLHETYGHYLMFKSKVWEEANFTPYVFQTVKRQSGNEPKDIWFKKALYVLRYGIEKHYDKVINGFNRKLVGMDHKKDAIYIAPTNNMVNTYNDSYLARNPNVKITFNVVFTGKYKKQNFPMDREVTIGEGCKFLTLVNSPEEGYMNGTLLTCTQATTEGIWAVKEDGSSVFVGVHEFKEEEVYAEECELYGKVVKVQKRKHIASAYMLPIKLAAGYSFARCQGKSFDYETVLDFGAASQSWMYTKSGMEDFMVAGAFVGFSRATNIDHVKLRNPLMKCHLKTDRDSIDFWWKCVTETKA